jgi:hypothetical protein
MSALSLAALPTCYEEAQRGSLRPCYNPFLGIMCRSSPVQPPAIKACSQCFQPAALPSAALSASYPALSGPCIKTDPEQERLYANLGPTRAPFATPILHEDGEITWHSFLPGDKGQEAEVYGKEIDVFFAGSKRPGIYEF